MNLLIVKYHREEVL